MDYSYPSRSFRSDDVIPLTKRPARDGFATSSARTRTNSYVELRTRGEHTHVLASSQNISASCRDPVRSRKIDQRARGLLCELVCGFANSRRENTCSGELAELFYELLRSCMCSQELAASCCMNLYVDLRTRTE